MPTYDVTVYYKGTITIEAKNRTELNETKIKILNSTVRSCGGIVSCTSRV